MTGKLRKTRSFSARLNVLALTPISPKTVSAPPSPGSESDAFARVPIEADSFLATVLEGFADEPVPIREERSEVRPSSPTLLTFTLEC